MATATVSDNGVTAVKERVSIQTVTPAMAEKWLEYNIHNRSLRETRVVHFAGILARGEWELTGDAIVFDSEGNLLNGQHRLSAVVVTEIPARFIVLRGVPAKTQEVMDQTLTRSVGDALKLRGYSNQYALASALGWMHHLAYTEKTGNVHYRDPGMRPSSKQLLQLFDQHPGLLEYIKPMTKFTRRFKARPGPMLAIMYRLHQINPTDADDFFEKLLDGVGLQRDDPVRLLREFLISDGKAVGGRRLVAWRANALFFKAWNFYRDQKPMSNLSWKYGPSNKDAWPVPR